MLFHLFSFSFSEYLVDDVVLLLNLPGLPGSERGGRFVPARLTLRLMVTLQTQP
jgi:hypothetical protein